MDQQEESRLRAALNARDAEMHGIRESANAWRQERNKVLLPSLRVVRLSNDTPSFASSSDNRRLTVRDRHTQRAGCPADALELGHFDED
jgi:hypothetical protein